MAGESYSPNMNLVLPGVGVTAGPVYASDINQSLNILDQHNHSAGSGVQITPDGININSDFTMNNNNIIAIKSLQLQDQVSALSGGSDLGCMYRVADDLYYNDGLGNQIRITQSGSIVGASGSIANLVSPASATFVTLSGTVVFESDVTVPANLDAGSLLMRNVSASSKALTLSPPTAMAADYSLVLPSLPVSQKIMTLDASGNMSAPYSIDNSTLEISSNIIRVKDSGIITAKIADANVTTAKIADANITNAKLASANIAVSSSCGNYAITTSPGTVPNMYDVTNLAVTLTCSGTRQVRLELHPVNSIAAGNPAYISSAALFPGLGTGVFISFYKDFATELGGAFIAGTPAETYLPATSFSFTTSSVMSAGSHYFSVKAGANNSSTGTVYGLKLVAFEV